METTCTELRSRESSRMGWPTKVAGSPLDMQTSSSNGRIHKTWSINSESPLSLASPPFHAQKDGAT